MLFQRSDITDEKFTLRILTDCIEIYEPYHEDRSMNGGKDIAVALGKVDQLSMMEEQLYFSFADINDFVASSISPNQIVGKTGVLAGYPICPQKQNSKTHKFNALMHELEVSIEQMAKKPNQHAVIYYKFPTNDSYNGSPIQLMKEYESREQYSTIAVHTGRFENKGVATVLNKKIVKEFIVPTYNRFKQHNNTTYLQDHFPNHVPSFHQFSTDKNSQNHKNIKYLTRMYQNYGVLAFAKLESRDYITLARYESG